MLNGNLLDYKIATIQDVDGPIDTILVESGMGYGPYGSVGIGEDIGTVMTGLLAPAVYNAIGEWIDDYPITPDKVLKALGKAVSRSSETCKDNPVQQSALSLLWCDACFVPRSSRITCWLIIGLSFPPAARGRVTLDRQRQ